MGHRAAYRILLMIVLICLTVLSCGRKMPPVPPGADLPAPVTGLTHHLEGYRVSLSWNAPSAEQGGAPAGYVVMRSVTDPDDHCEGCPLLFERAGTLGPSETHFSENVVPGRRYVYKVQALTAYRAAGADSDLIRFTVPQTDREGS